MTRMDLAAYVTGDLVDRGPGRWVTGIARLGVDGLATAGAMMLASYSAWATVDFWTVPLIWPDVAVLWFLLIAGKYWLVRGGNRTPVEQLRVAVFWVVAVYGSAMAYVLLTRTYYSRSFLLTSLIALLLWQMIDTLLLRSGSYTIRLAGVPSSAVESLRGLRGVELVILQRPRVEGGGGRTSGGHAPAPFP